MEDSVNEFYAPERILLIFAHADDIEFGLSGTVARWTELGSHVTYCIVTDNSAGSNIPGADLEALVETRKQEQIASAAAVGVTDVRFLGYKDGTLEPTLQLRKDLTRVIREVRPQLVVTFDPSTIVAEGGFYINHPDHRATGEAATYAVFPSAGTRPIFPELLEEGCEPHDVDRVYYMLSNSRDNQIVVDITSTFDRKVAALLCHKSQLNEEAIEFVKQWSGEAGKEKGYTYAESFRQVILREGPKKETVG